MRTKDDMRWQKLTGQSPLGALKAYSFRHGSRALRRLHAQSHWRKTMEVVNEVLGTPGAALEGQMLMVLGGSPTA